MFLNRLLTPRALTKPKPDGGSSLIATGRTRSGQDITADTALRVSSVFSCVRLLSETMAAMPLGLYQKQDRNRIEAKDHPLHQLLSNLPNSEMTSFDFRTQVMASLLLQGKSYSQILRDRAGRVGEIWPQMPNICQLDRDKSGKLVLVVEGEPKAWTMDKVFRINGLTTNGVDGLSPIGLMRETIGSAMAMEHYSAALFGNGAKPGGVLSIPGQLSSKGQDRLIESWNKTHGGADNANKVAVLQEGMKWEQIAMNAADAQFIESRKYNRSEIAGIYGVPPNMIGDLDRATFSNVENQGLQYVIYSCVPWITRFEQSAFRDLLTPEERKTYYTKFNVRGLLRGDTTARSAFYRELFNVGAYSPNMILALEDENPVEGGDQHFINGANMTLEQAKNNIVNGAPNAD